MVRDTWAEKGWGAHNGVRRDDAVEVKEPKSEHWDHQQGMGGYYL
jgi:hypothetical protein